MSSVNWPPRSASVRQIDNVTFRRDKQTVSGHQTGDKFCGHAPNDGIKLKLAL
jgi:hypothetical protein